MATVFFSYSHRDEALRDELEIHLSALKRQGIIESWHDRRIAAGEDFASMISANLERADIVLLLVSPYFLASNYCYDVEMKRALERSSAGEATVIPVILHPCDWHAAPFGKLQAVPTDGKPISKFPNQHDALLEVAKAVRAVAERLPLRSTGSPSATKEALRGAPATPRSSNLAIKRNFSDHDRDRFREESFSYLAKFFEGSLAELQRRNPGITTAFRAINADHFTATIYRDGKMVSQCGIRADGPLAKQIVYARDPSSTNSYNEALSVTDDGHLLSLKATGFTSRAGGRSNDSLSQQGAAELFWEILIEPLQR
jgi:hypothetical protein